MSDIITRALKSSNAVNDHSLPLRDRVWHAFEALSGLMFSDIDDGQRPAIESLLVASNEVLAKHANDSEFDYKNLTDAEAEEVLGYIGKANQICIDSEAGRVMRELDLAGRKLPVAAIEEVREHRDIFVPLLMQSLERAIGKVRNGEKVSGDSPFFALFLLTELKVDEAFPILRDAFLLPGDGASHIFGDAVHQLLPPMLAQFSHGNIDVIDEFVRAPNRNPYVRWSAIQTYTYFVRDGLISRQDAVDALHGHFQRSVKNEDYDLLAPLVCELGDLAAETALETIRLGYDRKQVDETIVDFKFIESQIAEGEETIKLTLERCRPTGMPDTIAELSCWAAFQERPPRLPVKPKTTPAGVPRPRRQLDDRVRTTPATQIRSDAKVGRNDPCPCGSGKKYKKCCHGS